MILLTSNSIRTSLVCFKRINVFAVLVRWRISQLTWAPTFFTRIFLIELLWDTCIYEISWRLFSIKRNSLNLFDSMLIVSIIERLLFNLIALAKIFFRLFHCISLWNESLGWIEFIFLLQRETVRFRIQEGFQYIPYLLVAVLLLKTIKYCIGSLFIGVIKYSIVYVSIELLLSKHRWIGW